MLLNANKLNRLTANAKNLKGPPNEKVTTALPDMFNLRNNDLLLFQAYQ